METLTDAAEGKGAAAVARGVRKGKSAAQDAVTVGPKSASRLGHTHTHTHHDSILTRTRYSSLSAATATAADAAARARRLCFEQPLSPASSTTVCNHHVYIA